MILVTGATGFLGQRLCRLLDERKLKYEKTSLSLGCDLRDPAAAKKLFAKVKPQYLLNCAASVGGISYGYKFPVELFRNNLLMTINLFECCQEFKIKRLVNPISNCAYPAKATLFKESEFWDGPLHESVLVYGFARKAAWIGSWAYEKQFGLDSINLIVSNMYGPGDHFEEARSHALGALVMKFCNAVRENAKQVVVWGTGNPVREWLYIDDAAEAMLRALDIPPHVDPINVGIASGLSMRELSELLKKKTGFKGEIVYDTSKPDGAPHKTVDGALGKKIMGWAPPTPLEKGIENTVEWYLSHTK
jgi:GDP-L-fucose synthase